MIGAGQAMLPAFYLELEDYALHGAQQEGTGDEPEPRAGRKQLWMEAVCDSDTFQRPLFSGDWRCANCGSGPLKWLKVRGYPALPWPS